MNRMVMESLARKHWAKWLPKKVAELKADGDLGEAIQGAAIRAEREIEDLLKQGYQRHEAEEVALPMFILLKPEPEANEEPRERRRSWPRRNDSTVRADGAAGRRPGEQPLRPRRTRAAAQVFGASGNAPTIGTATRPRHRRANTRLRNTVG